MADVTVAAGELLLIKIGDGGSPETFTHPCTINTSRGVSLSTSEATTEVADCATPSNPAYTDRRIKSYDTSVSGAGVMDTASTYAFITWWQSGAAKNVKIYQNLTGAQGGWVITQSMVLTDFQITGTRGERQEITLTLKGAGKPTIAANA